MLLAENDSVATFLHLATGSERPYWALGDNSDALRLGGSPACRDFACKLEACEAETIRLLESQPREVSCSISIYGQRFKIYLAGRRITHTEWGGIVSADSVLEMTDSMTNALMNENDRSKGTCEFSS